ncbi:MAG: PilZ domain-containing protein [Vicinamibacterales bacterium]
MSQRCTVLIAAPDLMPKLKERAAESAGGELLTFSDTDALRALEAILKRKPSVVAIEQRFSTTPRGQALINRMKADPTLGQSEIRLISQDGTHTLISGPAASAPAEAAKPAAKPAGPPATDVWSDAQPRRVDVMPVAAKPAAPPKAIAPAAPVRPAPPPAPPVKPIQQARSPISVPPPAPAAKPAVAREPVVPAVVDDRRIEAEGLVESIDLAVESESAGIELPADWIEQTSDTREVGEAVPINLDKAGDDTAKVATPAAPAPPTAPPATVETAPVVAALLDQTGTRRAARFKTDDAAGLTLDGDAAKLVDLSSLGAQVLSSAVLKPNQRVRLALTDKQGSLRFSGSVAWALFEIPPRYRAGIAFVDADPKAVDAFCERHKKT